MRKALTICCITGKLRILLCALGCLLLATGGGMELVDYPFFAARLTEAPTAVPSLTSIGIHVADPSPVLPRETALALTPVSTELIFPTPERREYADGETIGGIRIPRLDLSATIIEGSGDAELLLGVGHVRGGALPGENGHIVLAGHRVTRRMHPFRHLELLQPGDTVEIEYESRLYTYFVTERFIVKQNETWVLEAFDVDHETLTLITCHPPGSLRKRMIVRARLLESYSSPSKEQGEVNHE